MEIIKIRQDNDFKILFSFYDVRGEVMDETMQQFKFIYRDIYKNSYEISYDGKIRKNCYVEDGKLYGVFDNHGFQKGLITREEYFRFEDDSFSDKTWDFGNNYSTNIYIYERNDNY